MVEFEDSFDIEYCWKTVQMSLIFQIPSLESH